MQTMKSKTINISLRRAVLVNIDKKAKEEYRSRSELIKEAAVFYIQTKDNWSILQNDISSKAVNMGIKSDSDVEKLVDSMRK